MRCFAAYGCLLMAFATWAFPFHHLRTLGRWLAVIRDQRDQLHQPHRSGRRNVVWSSEGPPQHLHQQGKAQRGHCEQTQAPAQQSLYQLASRCRPQGVRQHCSGHGRSRGMCHKQQLTPSATQGRSWSTAPAKSWLSRTAAVRSPSPMAHCPWRLLGSLPHLQPP
ncbi:hypothetical protein V8C86DRAFT_2509314 [Haematococcus lacustris]